ncbi:hypothetical protein MGG_17137 [Pyricularia oryzae 70-15]|uniref:Uncharacterized protein n=4 Tax=Pyricularia oryzae TaxID=318829 RepID=G4NAT6_PYRO7|nr:uncharacterized protein MGG_17137 [Pyricularia oryzae 70-15]EHA50528.1 hypothetical protein MGG_17137 [Pyricularia oryzae 70-15]ELQ41622.1 hypothetical protein OOU_Y34scaffold00262g4 [Pyricularia oryzae Y34]
MHVWQGLRRQSHLCKGEELLIGLPEHLSGVCRHVGPLRPDESRPDFSNSPGIVSPVCATVKKQRF